MKIVKKREEIGGEKMEGDKISSQNKPIIERERRNFPVEELRTITDGDNPKHIVGYAAIFNSLSEEMYGFKEKIDPGAFAETIGADDIRALKNHNSDYVLGRNKSGTLTLSEDQRGLKIDVVPPDTQWANDYIASIDRSDIDQMSFGFRTLEERWEGEYPDEIRTLMKVQLFDVSPVTFPAYPDTEVGLRSLEEYRKTLKVKDEDVNTGNEYQISLDIRKKRLKLKEREEEL